MKGPAADRSTFDCSTIFSRVSCSVDNIISFRFPKTDFSLAKFLPDAQIVRAG